MEIQSNKPSIPMTRRNKYTETGSAFEAEHWLNQNPEIADEKVFSYNDLKKGVNFNLYPPMHSAEDVKEFFLKDLRDVLFNRSYEKALKAKREEFRKEVEALGDKMLFGEAFEKLKEKWTKPGAWENVPKPDQAEAIFANFRIRLFWWYAEKMEVSDSEIDLTRAVAFANNISRHLGDPTLQHLTDKSDGTDKSPADCADC